MKAILHRDSDRLTAHAERIKQGLERLGNAEVQAEAIPDRHHFFSCPEGCNHQRSVGFRIPFFYL
jgi:hypothetical protein